MPARYPHPRLLSRNAEDGSFVMRTGSARSHEEKQ